MFISTSFIKEYESAEIRHLDQMAAGILAKIPILRVRTFSSTSDKDRESGFWVREFRVGIFETVIGYSLHFKLLLVRSNGCFLVVSFHSGVIGQLSLLFTVTYLSFAPTCLSVSFHCRCGCTCVFRFNSLVSVTRIFTINNYCFSKYVDICSIKV